MRIKTKLKETEMVELKKSTSELKEGIISIASILNKHHNGELYFGVGNMGEVIGQQVGEKTIRDVSKSISDHIEPKIFPEITEIDIDGKKCILVKFEGLESPYFAYGRAYIRVGDDDRQLSAKELEKLFSEKNRTLWEKEISDKKLKDVNKDAVKDFMAKANRAKRVNFKFSNVESTLRKLNLIKGGRLLNAAEILFCDDNPLEIQAALFAGTDKLTFLDIRQFKGNLFHLLAQSEFYIKEHMNWRAELKTRTRKEIPEIPIRAITEALVNSLCHRDYANPNTNKIAVFKNRIEIYNPGQFPEGYEPEDFIKGKEDESVLRNPLIANALYLSEDIEKWASGLKRIHKACEEEDVKFEFKKRKSGFMVVFYRRPTGGKEGLGEKLGEKLGENQIKILELIGKNRFISIPEISEKIGISTTAVENNIAKLKKKGILKRVGPAKGGYWEIEQKEVKEK